LLPRRRDSQPQAVVAQGHRVRIYIPFGREWFPYFMRRLGERPANIAAVATIIAASAMAIFSGRTMGIGRPSRCSSTERSGRRSD
jgi:hypothetical protein